jgi:predicted HTH transcriptional regulator
MRGKREYSESHVKSIKNTMMIIDLIHDGENSLVEFKNTRFPAMAQWLKDYGISEKVGCGLFKITQFYKRAQLPAPHFITEPQSFQVIPVRANPT